MNGLTVFRNVALQQTVTFIVLLHLINISIDTLDPVQQEGFWVSEIESVYELISEQMLGMDNFVADQDEHDIEKSSVNAAASLVVVDVAPQHVIFPEFKPIFVASLEASQGLRNFYSNIAYGKRTPPPRIA